MHCVSHHPPSNYSTTSVPAHISVVCCFSHACNARKFCSLLACDDAQGTWSQHTLPDCIPVATLAKHCTESRKRGWMYSIKSGLLCPSKACVHGVAMTWTMQSQVAEGFTGFHDTLMQPVCCAHVNRFTCMRVVCNCVSSTLPTSLSRPTIEASAGPTDLLPTCKQGGQGRGAGVG